MTPSSIEKHLFDGRFALVGLGPAPVALHPALLAYLDVRWPGEVGFYTLDTSRPAPRGLWDRVLRTRAGAMRIGPSGPERGTYLFEYGLVVGFHRGGASLTSEYDHLEAPIEAAWGRPLPVRESRIILGEAGYFSEIIQRRLSPQESWSEAPKEEAPPPRPAPAPVQEDAYEVLGIDASATDAEVTAAYKQAMKLNHPDKVAHLSPALQKFAEQQTVAIQAAYARIRALRKA